jgi:hypothetical protein
MIDCPAEAPETAKRALESACTLFWADLGSCANKLRISVERTLDEVDIPETRNLNERIKAFEKIDPEHGQSFHALRQLGNVGIHQGDNTRETVLDAFEAHFVICSAVPQRPNCSAKKKDSRRQKEDKHGAA